MKHKMNTGYAKFLKDEGRKLAGIEVLHYDEEYIQIKIPASKDAKTDWYMVECMEGYWRCQCHDYHIMQGRTEQRVGIGSYCCKHIEEAHYKIAKLKGIFEQQTLIHNPDENWREAKVTKIYKDGYQLQFQGVNFNYPKGSSIKMGNFNYKIIDCRIKGDTTIIELKKEESDGTGNKE